jgi:hypothetical protein
MELSDRARQRRPATGRPRHVVDPRAALTTDRATTQIIVSGTARVGVLAAGGERSEQQRLVNVKRVGGRRRRRGVAASFASTETVNAPIRMAAAAAARVARIVVCPFRLPMLSMSRKAGERSKFGRGLTPTLGLVDPSYRRELPLHLAMTLGLFMSGCCIALIIVLQLGS